MFDKLPLDRPLPAPVLVHVEPPVLGLLPPVLPAPPVALPPPVLPVFFPAELVLPAVLTVLPPTAIESAFELLVPPSLVPPVPVVPPALDVPPVALDVLPLVLVVPPAAFVETSSSAHTACHGHRLVPGMRLMVSSGSPTIACWGLPARKCLQAIKIATGVRCNS